MNTELDENKEQQQLGQTGEAKPTIQAALLKAEEEAGRLYPPIFIRALGDTCSNLVSEWLDKNGAPGEIVELGEYTVMLERCATSAADGCLAVWDAIYLGQEVPAITRKIALAGGGFGGDIATALPISRYPNEGNEQDGYEEILGIVHGFIHDPRVKKLVAELKEGLKDLEKSIDEHAQQDEAVEAGVDFDPLPVCEAFGGIVKVQERLGAAIRDLDDLVNRKAQQA